MKQYIKPSLKPLGLLRMVTKFSRITIIGIPGID
jgi:hypothetical protein